MLKIWKIKNNIYKIFNFKYFLYFFTSKTWIDKINEGIGDWGVGSVYLGGGGYPHCPKPPFPNPQSPIPN